MALKDSGRQMSHVTPVQGLGWGILEAFSVDTPASLNPAITSGKLLLPGGKTITLSDSDFDYIGPAANGLISDDDITSVFFSPSAYFEATDTAVPTANSGAIYSNLTGTKTNPNDIRLYTATAASGAVTKIVWGDWYNVQAVNLGSANIGATGDKLQSLFEGINGRAAYCIGIVGVTTTTVSTDTGTISLQSLDLETGAEVELGTLVCTVKTLDLDVLANIDWSELTTYKVVQPLQPLVVECTEASTAGVVQVYGLFGGYPSELYV